MMKKEGATLSQDYFDEMYTANRDPWNFEKSDYERQKYAKTIKSLTRKRYKSALELGCSIGVLTQKLAKYCDELLAIDISEMALKIARKRLEKQQHVVIKKAAIPDHFPNGHYDLILMSEVGYYLSLRDLVRAKDLIKKSLKANGDLVLVHWTHEVQDYPLSGDQVHEVFLKDLEFEEISSFRTSDYRLNALRKV